MSLKIDPEETSNSKPKMMKKTNSRSYTRTLTDSRDNSVDNSLNHQDHHEIHEDSGDEVDLVGTFGGTFPSPIDTTPVSPVMESNLECTFPSTTTIGSEDTTNLTVNVHIPEDCRTNEFLRDLPWSALPLNSSIANHENDKMTQCLCIFKRFVVRDGPFALNIAYHSYLETKQRFEDCYRRSHQYNDPTLATQLERDLLCVFDPVIRDVVDNLENVANRFNVERMMASDI